MGNLPAKIPWYNDLKTTSALGNGTFVRIKAGLDTAALEKRNGLSWCSETMDPLVGRLGMVFSGSSLDSSVDDKTDMSMVGFDVDNDGAEEGINYRPFYFLNEWLDVVPQAEVDQELQSALQARLSAFTAKIEEIHAREEAAAEQESDNDSGECGSDSDNNDKSDKRSSKTFGGGDRKTRVGGEEMIDLLRMIGGERSKRQEEKKQSKKQKIQVGDSAADMGTEKTLHKLTVTIMRLSNQVAKLQDKIDCLCNQ